MKQLTKKPIAHLALGFARHTSLPFAKPKQLKFSQRTDKQTDYNPYTFYIEKRDNKYKYLF